MIIKQINLTLSLHERIKTCKVLPGVAKTQVKARSWKAVFLFPKYFYKEEKTKLNNKDDPMSIKRLALYHEFLQRVSYCILAIHGGSDPLAQPPSCLGFEVVEAS